MQDSADGTYFDGVTAEVHEAYLLMAGDYLMITPDGFGAVYWPLDDIAMSHDVRRGHLRLQNANDPDARLADATGEDWGGINLRFAAAGM